MAPRPGTTQRRAGGATPGDGAVVARTVARDGRGGAPGRSGGANRSQGQGAAATYRSAIFLEGNHGKGRHDCFGRKPREECDVFGRKPREGEFADIKRFFKRKPREACDVFGRKP